MESLDVPYKVNLPVFEGPLDLLLFLIRKNDLNIYDIPVAFIADEYLRLLDQMRELNIDVAGEFLVMAAELARIKSRMLLPQTGEEEEEEGGDPAAELARRLLEYQRYKEAARVLCLRPMLGRDIFKRPPTKTEEGSRTQTPEETPVSSDVYQLIQAFQTTLRRLPKKTYHEISVDRLSINQRILQIVEYLDRHESMEMGQLIPEEAGRYEVVITFLALLEMARMKMIQVYQDQAFDRVLIRKKMTSVEQEEAFHLVEKGEV